MFGMSNRGRGRDRCEMVHVDPDQAGMQAGSSVNIGGIERIVSAVGGGALATTGVWYMLRKSSPLGLLMVAAGGVLAWRGLSGRSRVYQAVGVTGEDTELLSHPFSREIKVEHSIAVRKPPHELYQFWRNFRNLPQVMQHLERVEVLDDRRSRWTAKGPADQPVTWDAEVLADKPNELIEWCSLEGSTVDTRGSVRFQPGSGGRDTVIRLDLYYNPPGGVLGAAIAKLFGRDPATEVRNDLRQFKQKLETGEIAIGAVGSGWETGNTPRQAVGSRFGADPVEQGSRESFPASDAPGWRPSP